MRLLALVGPGTNSRCNFMDLLRGAQLAGHTVFVEDTVLFTAQHQALQQAAKGEPHAAARLEDYRAGYARYLGHTLRTRRCDAVVCLWVDPTTMLPWVKARPDSQTATFLEAAGIPAVYWWLDAPFWAYGGQGPRLLDRSLYTGPLHLHVVNNPGTADEMRRIFGLKHVIAQPYGVDEAIFRPMSGTSDGPREYDLAICAGVGDEPPTEIMKAELEKAEPSVTAIRRSLAESLAGKVGAVIEGAAPRLAKEACSALARAWLAEQVRDPDRPMLHKFEAAVATTPGAEPIVAALTASPTAGIHWAAATHQVRRVDAWQRAFTAAYLSRRFKCLIVGHAAPAWEQAGWGVRGERTGFVGYHELSACYARSAAGLNVMRYQDDIGLNPKVLEIAASGCVPLQRRRVGLSEAFVEGEEVVAFASPAEAADRLGRLLADTKARDRIGRAALARVRQEHTWTHRAAELFQRVATPLPGG